MIEWSAVIEYVAQPQFWFSLLQIILIDILLGGDNAILIGMASRQLPAHQRRLAIIWGTVGAVGLRVVLIAFALTLLNVPMLKIVGGLLLLWIGVKLLIGGDADKEVSASDKLLAAIKTIIVADAVMSLDNVIAVAAAAKGDLFLVTFGILISIPIVVWGSQLVLKLMDKYPSVILFGAALLGWLAGGMLVGDALVRDQLASYMPWLKYLVEVVGALFVVGLGSYLARQRQLKSASGAH